MKRRLARKKAIQALFQIDRSGADTQEAIDNVLEDNEQADPFFVSLVKGTLQRLQEVDPLIAKQLQHWKMERISNVDRQILRMAAFEIFYMNEIPRNVTYNEAVELAKLFGGEESGSFVNGVLSNIAQIEETKGEDDDSGNH